MSRTSGKVHVVGVKKTHVDKRGDRREYSSAYLRRTYREGQRVRNETVANLSALPEHVVDWIDAGLKGEQLVPAGSEFSIARSLPHGHVAAVAAMARTLGLPALLGPSCRARDTGARADSLAGGAPGVEAGHRRVVARCHPGSRSRCRRRQHRRDLRRDGLAARAPRRHRSQARRQTSWARRESVADGVVRPDQLVGDRALL